MNDLMTKSFLSYVELKKQCRIDAIEPNHHDVEKGQVRAGDEPNLSKFFQQVDSIKSEMGEIANLLADLQTLIEETKTTHQSKLLRGLKDRIDSDVVSVLRKGNIVKSRLQQLDNSNSKNRMNGSAVDRTRVSVTNGLRKKLRDLMNEFQFLRDKVVSDHKEFLGGDTVAGGGDMVTGGGVLEENRERHEAVMGLERSLNSLHQVFLDMAVLVEAQGEVFDDIEVNVAVAGSYVGGGTNSLFYAKQMKKEGKRWVFWVWCVVVIVLLVCVISLFCY